MNVLSLFDGMSCGRIALERLGIQVDNYYASEIDKYAIQVSQANYPDIIQVGNVTELDTSTLPKIDLIMGGSPCQGFSFAGKQLAFNDPRSALFFEFVRCVEELKPKYFLLENVRMKKEYLDVISEYMGVEPIMINSALVSAQNRVRYYWTNIPGIEQPEQRGIVLRDILETNASNEYLAGENLQKNYKGGNQLNPNYKSQANTIHNTEGKSGTICAGTHGYANGYVKDTERNQRHYRNDDEKSLCMTATMYKGAGNNSMTLVPQKPIKKEYISKQSVEKYVEDINAEFNDPYNKKTVKGDKSTTLRTNSSNGNMWVNEKAMKETHDTPKQVGIAVDKPNQINPSKKANGVQPYMQDRVFHVDGKSHCLTKEFASRTNVGETIEVDKEKKQLTIKEATKKGYTTIEDGDCFDMTFPKSKTRRGRNMKDKSNCLTAANYDYMRYEHSDEDKEVYWRKLTPVECERLQTVPDNYTNHVSNTQRYKMLGNGWTIEVITHILKNMEL
jgi:DNA-cytosine methyltransferase